MEPGAPTLQSEPKSGYALVIVHMQHLFADPKERHVRALIERQLEVIAACQSHGAPVVLTSACGARNVYAPLRAAARRSPHNQMIADTGISVFNGTTLADYLRNVGTTDILLMGMHAECCVSESARDALKIGFNVHSSADVLLRARPEADSSYWDGMPGTSYAHRHDLIALLEK